MLLPPPQIACRKASKNGKKKDGNGCENWKKR